MKAAYYAVTMAVAWRCNNYYTTLSGV